MNWGYWLGGALIAIGLIMLAVFCFGLVEAVRDRRRYRARRDRRAERVVRASMRAKGWDRP